MSEDTVISLAPAAGAGIGKKIAEALLADPEFIPLMKAAIINGLRASRSLWVKGPDGKSKLINEPDSKVQIQAFALTMAHMEGEPVKRIIHQHLAGDKELNPLGALRDSPELLDAMRDLVEKAEFRHTPGKRSHAYAQARKAAAAQAAVLVEESEG